MIGCWHALKNDQARQVLISLGTRVGGYDLVVERCDGEACWHWAVLSRLGHEIEVGTARDAHSAERFAEEAAFHIHPPTLGDWIARLM